MAKAIPCHTEPSAPVLSGKGIDTPVLVCSQIHVMFGHSIPSRVPYPFNPGLPMAIDNDVELMVICWRCTELELQLRG